MVNSTCREWLTAVYNQRFDGTCLAISFAEMVQVTLVMCGRVPRGFRLTPQNIIDIIGVNRNAAAVWDFCQTNMRSYGLEEEHFNPFVNISREIPANRAAEAFSGTRANRWRLSRIMRAGDPNIIKTRICEMFDDRGFKYPCVVLVRMCGFNGVVARQVARGDYVDPVTGVKGGLYRPTQAEKTEFKAQGNAMHAMVLVGANTESEDESLHYCWVKNSHGVEWGEDGFSKIPFDFIEFLFSPVPSADPVHF